MNIRIYSQEKLDEVAEAVQANSTIAYCAPVLNSTNMVEDKVRALAISFLESRAENKDQIDLYYLSSVLVSSGWNKNDDVFDPQELWTARSTPEDKQFNFMHNEKDIIGHITGNRVLSFDGEELNKNIDWAEAGSPVDFNIITNAVLYTGWSDEDLRNRMRKLIAEIEEGGNWFVSMECMFPDFDYALKDSSGEAKVVKREEASAFLTKHLRAYGGTGKFEGYTVGRLLRDISFSGKGLVSKPANPRSVIIQDSESFNESESRLVTVSSKENEMSDILEKQVNELKAELAEALKASDTMKQEMETQKSEAIKNQLEAFEGTISEKDEDIATLEAKVELTEAKVAELEESLSAAETSKEEAIAEIDEIKKTTALEKRRSALTEAGLNEEETDEAIAKLGELSDESFDFVVEAMKRPPVKGDKENPFEKKKKKDEEEEEAKNKASESLDEETDEAEAQAEVLDDVEEDSDVAMAEATDGEDPAEELRSSASEWFGSLLQSTTNLK